MRDFGSLRLRQRLVPLPVFSNRDTVSSCLFFKTEEAKQGGQEGYLKIFLLARRDSE
jgi:hypothetical protein